MRNSTCNNILKSLFDGPVLLKYYCFFFFYEKGMQSVSEDAFTVQYPDNAFNCLRDNTDNHFEGTDYWCAADMISDHRY